MLNYFVKMRLNLIFHDYSEFELNDNLDFLPYFYCNH